MVRMSLVDDEDVVRSAAAQAFDVLQEHIGAKAIDQTIPTLLEALRQPGQSSGTALQALREVMSVSNSSVHERELVLNKSLGSSFNGIPGPHPHAYGYPYDRVQCSGTCIVGFCGRYRAE